MQQPLPTPFVTMEPAAKKCKANAKAIAAFESTSQLTPKDTLKIFKPFTTKQLLEILQDAAILHHDVLDAVWNIANRDHFINPNQLQ
ncbi:hypothetical protein MRB53_034804 [Persea americana]|uniref:Uncharacterized protein n=1 Tax=Persea americana TaxID=3435 RepID=A0ACC2K2V3_PERAE|nr:hypothetical protein MRB53_034804 [Persea americana]